MAALVSIPDLWCGCLERHVDSLSHKWQRERVRKPPTDHIATEPIQDSNQIQPASAQTDICDVAAPNLIWCLSCHATQKIGIDAMVGGPLAEIRARMNSITTQSRTDVRIPMASQTGK